MSKSPIMHYNYENSLCCTKDREYNRFLIEIYNCNHDKKIIGLIKITSRDINLNKLKEYFKVHCQFIKGIRTDYILETKSTYDGVDYNFKKNYKAEDIKYSYISIKLVNKKMISKRVKEYDSFESFELERMSKGWNYNNFIAPYDI